MKTLFMLLLLAFPVLAQDNVRFFGEIDVSQGAGIKNPILAGGFGFDKSLSKRIQVDGNLLIRRTRKIPGEGYSLAGNTSFRFGKEVFAIGGVNLARQHTNLYDKLTTNFFAGIGKRSTSGVFSGIFYFPDLTSENKLWGGRVERQIFASRHLFVQPHVSAFRFNCFQTKKCNSFQAGVAIGGHF